MIRRAWSGEYFEFDGEMMTIPEPGVLWDHAMSPKDEAFMDLETDEIRKLAVCTSTRQVNLPGGPHDCALL